MAYLNDHSVDLIGAEFELVARQAVSQTQGHSHHLLLRETSHEAISLASDAPHQFLDI